MKVNKREDINQYKGDDDDMFPRIRQQCVNNDDVT